MRMQGTSTSCALWHVFLLICVNSLGSDGARNDTKRLAEWVEPHTFLKQDGCIKSFLKGLQKVIAVSACKPRPVLIDLMPPSSEIKFYPSKVEVNRCDGTCHEKLKCIPTEKEAVSVKVQQINYLGSDIQPECGEVKVEQHTKCTCQCTVTKEQCTKKQVYQPGDCNCLCSNDDEKSKCLYEEKTWDNEQCLCMP